MSSVLLRLRELDDSLSTAEKHIAKYIRSNAQEATTMTIHQLAEKSFTSPSSVVRLCTRAGFSGFKELKHALTVELATLNLDTQRKNIKVDNEDLIPTVIDKVTYQNIQSLEETVHLLDANAIEHCVDLLFQCKRVLLFGIGSSQLVAQDFYLKLLRLNKDVVVNQDIHSQLLQAKNSSSNDIAMIYSYSGETSEILDLLDYLQINKTPIVSITRYVHSQLSKRSTYCLYTSASEPLFRHGAMSSRLAQLNINDILLSVLINKDYNKNMSQLTFTHIKKQDR